MKSQNNYINKIQKLFLASKKEIEKYGEEIKGKIDYSYEHLREVQLNINHHQTVILDEINNKTKNSGSYFASEKEIVVKIFSGLKLFLDPRDIAVTPHLVLDSIWEHRITAAWLSVVGADDTVLDIGANFGYYGALAAQLTNKKKSKVVFFEPNPNLIPYIKKSLDTNWLNEQSVVENCAISDKEGYATLHLLKDYVGSSSLYSTAELEKFMNDKMHLETAQKIKVPINTIDNYCKKNKINEINLIKMDIEGYEDKAYKGMRDIVKNSPNITMFIEFTRQAYSDPINFYNEMLNDFGHVYVINDEGIIEKPKNDSYEAIIGKSDDWVMPIFSKKSNLNKQ